MPALTYPSGDFQPFTRILSSEVNGKFNAIRTLLNTTKLDDTNYQDNGMSLVKLKGVINNAFIANSTTGVVTALTTAANQTVFTSTDGTVVVGQLPPQAGGTGVSYTVSTLDIGLVLQVNSTGTALTFSTTPEPATNKIYSFYNFR